MTTDDIVVRLRKLSGCVGQQAEYAGMIAAVLEEVAEEMDEAIEEIERLRRELVEANARTERVRPCGLALDARTGMLD